MKTVTFTERVGEFLGPVDWDYDFRQHFNCLCTSDAGRDEACDKQKRRLKMVAESPEHFEVTTYGGWPRCGWGSVVLVGMYDGWPYWRPVPTVAYRTSLGVEHASFCSITNIRDIRTGEVL